MKHEFLLFKPPGLRYLVSAALEKQYSHHRRHSAAVNTDLILVAAPNESSQPQAEEALPSEQRLPRRHLTIASSQNYVTEGAHTKVTFIIIFNSTCQY